MFKNKLIRSHIYQRRRTITGVLRRRIVEKPLAAGKIKRGVFARVTVMVKISHVGRHRSIIPGVTAGSMRQKGQIVVFGTNSIVQPIGISKTRIGLNVAGTPRECTATFSIDIGSAPLNITIVYIDMGRSRRHSYFVTTRSGIVP